MARSAGEALEEARKRLNDIVDHFAFLLGTYPWSTTIPGRVIAPDFHLKSEHLPACESLA